MNDNGAADLHLKMVGVMREKKLNSKTIKWEFQRKDDHYLNEETPEDLLNAKPKQQTCVRLTEKQKIKLQKAVPTIQDPRKSRFSHSKLLVIQKISFLLTVLIFFLSVVKTQVDFLRLSSRNLSLTLMNTISLCTLMLIFVITLRHICLFELMVDQKKIYLLKKPKQWWVTAFFRKKQNIKTLIIEILVILPHPVSYLDGVSFQLLQTYDQVMMTHHLNDMLAILLLMKTFIIVRSLVNITIYSSPRSSRLCHQNGIEHNLLYTIKCILNQEPLGAISIIFIILILVFGNGLKLSEGVLALYNEDIGSVVFYSTGTLQTYQNCFWCVFITMSTVGYGEYYPKTLPGRYIIFITAISGVLLSSLLIVSLSSKLEMQPSQAKAHITLLRLSQQAELSRQAADALAETIRINTIMNEQGEKKDCNQENAMSESSQQTSSNKGSILSSNINIPKSAQKKVKQTDNLKQAFMNLKKKIDLVKMRTRQIKNMVDTTNIIEEMNRLFYILKDHLKDIYLKQRQLKESIEKVEEINSIKLSFIKEVSEMLSSYH